MSVSGSLPVLIVGAGSSGLLAALVLAQSGVEIRIIDKAEKFHVGSRGFGIQPRTLELLQTLGVADDFQAQYTDIPTMRAYKIPGGTQVVKEWDLYVKNDRIWPDRPFANGGCLAQEHQESILRDHLAKYGVTVELGKGLVSLQQTSGSVVATLADFQDGVATSTEEVVTCKYLIGSDGARGITRKLLGLTFEGETRDADGGVWGDVDIKGLDTNYWHVYGVPQKFSIMIRPLSPHTPSTRFGLGILGQGFDPKDISTPEKVVAFIKEQIGLQNLEFGEFTWLSYFKPNMRLVNRFRQGRAFVVGDAAHVHSPAGGQGMNNSVQDASNLAWKLALVAKGLARPELLNTYNEERLPVIAQVLSTTTSLHTHLVTSTNPEDSAPPQPSPRPNNSDGTKEKSGWFQWRNAALELYGVNYRFSSIVVEGRNPNPTEKERALAQAYAGYEGKGDLQAGDRAPEAPGLFTSSGDETSIFKLLNHAKHSVFIFSPSVESAQPAMSAVAKYSADVIQAYIILPGAQSEHHATLSRESIHVLVDKFAHAYDSYLVSPGQHTVVVIRPDGFIGAIVQDGVDVERYFSNIFS